MVSISKNAAKDPISQGDFEAFQRGSFNFASSVSKVTVFTGLTQVGCPDDSIKCLEFSAPFVVGSQQTIERFNLTVTFAFPKTAEIRVSRLPDSHIDSTHIEGVQIVDGRILPLFWPESDDGSKATHVFDTKDTYRLIDLKGIQVSKGLQVS